MSTHKRAGTRINDFLFDPNQTYQAVADIMMDYQLNHPLNCLCDRCKSVRGKTVTEICDPADQFENIWPDAMRAEDV